MGDLAHIEVWMTRGTVPGDGLTALDARLTSAVTPGDDALVGSRQLRPHTKVDSRSAAFVGPEASCTSSVTNVVTPNLGVARSPIDSTSEGAAVPEGLCPTLDRDSRTAVTSDQTHISLYIDSGKAYLRIRSRPHNSIFTRGGLT